MSDEFGTVSIRRGGSAREIEVLRRRCRQHRDTLMRLVSDAPTEHLAVEYQRLVRDIDASLAKLDELDRHATGAGPAHSSAVALAANPAVAIPSAAAAGAQPHGATPAAEDLSDTLRGPTEPGSRTLIAAPGETADATVHGASFATETSTQSRMLLIVLAAILVLAVIGALIWRASSDRKAASAQTATATAVTETAPPTIAPVKAPPKSVPPIVVVPAVVDFGTIVKGTRAARQLEITNNGTAPVAIAVSRSQCRCFFYEYAQQVGPKKKETITVVVDGARAKAGTLDETITVSARKDPSIVTTFQVTGTVR